MKCAIRTYVRTYVAIILSFACFVIHAVFALVRMYVRTYVSMYAPCCTVVLSYIRMTHYITSLRKLEVHSLVYYYHLQTRRCSVEFCTNVEVTSNLGKSE